jgi:hypothetical protein
MKTLFITMAAATTLVVSKYSFADLVMTTPVETFATVAKAPTKKIKKTKKMKKPQQAKPSAPRAQKKLESAPGIDRSEALRFIAINSNDIQVIANFTPPGFAPNPYSLTEYSFLQIQDNYKESGTLVRYDLFSCKKTKAADVFECSIPLEEPVPDRAPRKGLFTAKLQVVGTGFQMLPAAEIMTAGEVAPAKSIRLDEVL